MSTKVGMHPDYQGLSASTIKAGAEQSLRRLGIDHIDHIDLYHSHYDDPSVPVEEIVTALDDLVKAGKVRAVAASNLSAERLRASLDFAERENLARYVAIHQPVVQARSEGFRVPHASAAVTRRRPRRRPGRGGSRSRGRPGGEA